MMLVTILFGALAALFAALFFLQRANLRRACRELRQINQEGGTRRLHLSSPDGEMEALFEEINRALDIYRGTRACAGGDRRAHTLFANAHQRLL